jgi:multiple sugar transport system substrate-binding protein
MWWWSERRTPVTDVIAEGRTRRGLLRRLGGLTAGAGLLPALAACGGQPATQPRALDANQKDELTWLIIYGDYSPRKDAYDAMQRRFNQAFPNVTLQRIDMGAEPLEKITTLMAGGERIDLCGTRPDLLASFVEGPNPLQDLRTYLKRDTATIKEADHAEGPVAALTWKGTLYALPVGVYTNVVAVNHDLLEQRGITPPGPSWTIEQMVDIARRVTMRRDTEESSIWGMHQHWAVITHFPYSWIRGNGGEPLVPNEAITRAQWSTDAPTVKTVQWLVDLSQKTGVMPVEPVGAVLGTFREGRTAMGVMEVNNLFLIPQSQAQGGAQFKWDVQQLPAMEKGRYFPDRGFAYGMARNSKNPDLAWELLKQVIGPAGQTDWYRNARFAPSIKSLLNGAYLQETDEPKNKKAIVDSILAAKPMPKSPSWWEMDQGITVKSLARIRAGAVSVNEGLADLDRQLNAVLQRR